MLECVDSTFMSPALRWMIPTVTFQENFFTWNFQEAGLLSEPSDSDSEQFFGHCRAHTKSELLKKRKKNFLQHQLHYR